MVDKVERFWNRQMKIFYKLFTHTVNCTIHKEVVSLIFCHHNLFNVLIAFCVKKQY